MFVEEQPINQYVTEHRIEVTEKSDEPVIQLLDHILKCVKAKCIRYSY